MPQENDAPQDPQINFIEPPAEEAALPEQKEHFALPARFGAVPVDEAPLGWEKETRPSQVQVTKFQHIYPTIRLPFQEVQRVEFSHNHQFLAENEQNRKLKELFPTGANRLFFGDNLHIMRQLPSNSIDLIYIDPPFFSGRNYNVIFGDKNESRSFTDIWEGGMPGYLIWLNARLWEMKRLLKPKGSIYVHLDWHASHYVKVEMDKIFGVDNFRDNLVWCYKTRQFSKRYWNRKHDDILFYTKSSDYVFNWDAEGVLEPYDPNTVKKYKLVDENGPYRLCGRGIKGSPIQSAKDVDPSWEITNPELVVRNYLGNGYAPSDWHVMDIINQVADERIGYPTQKPEKLIEKIMAASSSEGSIVADFFCGGGTSPAVAQRLNRRWVACDQSRIAVAITADRVSKVVREKVGNLFPVPDFTVEHWGIYEAPKLEQYTLEQFREFVVKAFGGRLESVSKFIHGVRYGIPLYVGEPSRQSQITKEDVAKFANAVYTERRANHGVMLGWNFGADARKAAEILAARENKRIDFVRLSLIRLEDDEFREHIVNKNQDYAPLLCFIQPPEVRVKYRRLKYLTYEFDVSESVSLNKDGAIANVQWDFAHKAGHFVSTQGYAFMRDKKTNKPLTVVEYEFSAEGEHKVACSVQDNQGGERTTVMQVEVK